MTEILRDSIWQFIGALLALITLGVTIIIFIIQKKKKALSYRVVTDTALLTVKEEIKGELQIIYENVPVQDVHLLVLKLENNGNVPIASSDFEEPLAFSFGDTTKILSAEVTEVSPKTLKPKIFVKDSNKVLLEPMLLNSKDNFSVKLLLTQYSKQILPESRIIGVGEVKKLVDMSRKVFLLVGAFVGLLINGIGQILVDVPKGESTDIVRKILALTIPIILTVSLFAAIEVDRRFFKKGE